MDIEKVGKTIAYLRKRAGYTQKELADRIGISDKAVSKWERGLGLPEIAYLRKLSILLDTDTDSLLAGNIAHHNTDWEGILILEKSVHGISADTIIYDKPLLNFLLSYFLLLGMKKIHVVCGENDKQAIIRLVGNGNDYGVQIHCSNDLPAIGSIEASNLMVIYGRCILYGVDQTRFFQRAMVDRDHLTILALPKKAESIHVGLDMKVLDSNKPERLRTQYDYSRIPVLFLPTALYPKLCKGNDVLSFIEQQDTYVEMLDRGFVEIEVNDWNDVQEASTFLRIVQERCGMNVYCLEEVAWRRGFISLEKMRNLGERKKDTEYGAYVLSLCDRMCMK